MTTFFSGPGFGGAKPTSIESQALRDINSREKSFANKDFVKNVAWLNYSVDTLSAYTQKLQKGVEDANQNAIEQVQGVFADLLVLFAGGEPTGVDVGDLKYILQGIGALFGINGSTPFPVNLVEAAWHMFSTYIVPSDQFTDLLFDSIEAWAVDAGLSPDFIDSLQALHDALGEVGESVDIFIGSLSDLLGALGFMSFNDLGDALHGLTDLFGGISLPPLQPVIRTLADLGIPFIDALTWVIQQVNGLLRGLAGTDVVELGSNMVPVVSNKTTLWNIGSNSTNAWIFDATFAAVGSDGSFTTLGTGLAKRVTTVQILPIDAGKSIVVSGQLRWSGIPTVPTQFGVCAVWFQGNTEVGQTNVNIAGGHGATGGWTLSSQEIVAPFNADGFKIGCYVGTQITTGQVWADELAAQKKGIIHHSIIPGLDTSKIISGQFAQDMVEGLVSGLSNLWDGISNATHNLITTIIPGSAGALDDLGVWVQDVLSGGWLRHFAASLTGKANGTLADIENWANNLMKAGSKIHISNILGLPDFSLFPISRVGKQVTSGNLLSNPAFSIPVDTTGWDWEWVGPQLFCLTIGGTGEPVNAGHASQVGNFIDEDFWSRVPIDYPGALFPMTGSINAGIEDTVATVQSLPVGSKIAIVAVSQGAVIASKVWEDEFVNPAGRLHSRMGDVVAAVTFGNPRRKAGSHAPGTPDPGGHGIASGDLQVDVPSWWYDYANPDDIVPTVPSGAGGEWASLVYEFLQTDWDGISETLLTQVLSLFTNPFGDITSVVKLLQMIAGDIWKSFSGNNPHTTYNTVKIDGVNTSVQLAIDYLDQVGSDNVPDAGVDFKDHTTGGSGALTAVANGTWRQWEHPDAIAVVEGQKLDVSAWITGENIVWSGSGQVFYIYLDLLDSLGAHIGYEYPGFTHANVGTFDWVQVTGSYTVAANVATVRFLIAVDSTVTSGKLTVDDLSLTKTELIQQSHVNGLVGALTQFTNDIATGASNLVNLLTDLWNNPAGVINNLVESMIPGLHASKIVAGQFAQSLVAGLPNLASLFNNKQLGGTNLADDPETNTPSLWAASSDPVTTVSNEQTYVAGGTSIKQVAISGGYPAMYLVKKADGTSKQTVTTPGDKFSVSIKARRKSTTAATALVYVQAGLHDSTGTLSDSFINSSNVTASTTSWTDVSAIFTIPAGYDNVFFLTGMLNTANSGSVASVGDTHYFAKPVIREVTESRNIIQALFGTVTSSLTSLVDSIIPGLNASKIIAGQFGQNMVIGLTNLFGAFFRKTAGGPNIVVDPSFENTALWNGPGSSSNISTTRKHSGAQSMKLTGTDAFFTPLANGAGYTDWTSYSMKAKSGQKFKISGKVWRESGNSSAGSLYIGSQVVDAPGSYAYPGIDAWAQTTFTPGVWSDFSTIWTVPGIGYINAGQPITDAALYIQATSGFGATDVFYIDDISITEVTETQSIIAALFGGLQSIGSSIVDSMIPGLNASKIITGQFAQSLVANLTRDLGFFRSKSSQGPNMIADPFLLDRTLDSLRDTNGYTVTGPHSGGALPLGTYALRLDYSGSNYPSWGTSPNLTISSFPVKAGQKWYMGEWVYRMAGYTGLGETALFFALYDSTGVNTNSYSPVFWNDIPPTGAWTKHGGYLTIPAGYDTAYAYFASARPNNGGTSQFFFTGFELREVTESQNIVQALFGSVGSAFTSLVDSIIPGLNASKIISGTLAQSLIPDITEAMSSGVQSAKNALQSLYETLYNGVKGVPLIGATLAHILSGFQSLMTGLFGNTAPQTTVTTTAVPMLSPTKIDPIGGRFDQQNIPDVTAWMSTDTQTIIDAVHQVANGGDSTGNSPDSVATNLVKLLEPPANPSIATSVTIDHVGTGAQSNNTNSYVIAQAVGSQQIGPTANVVVATIVGESGPLNNIGGMSAFRRTVLCGSVPMTSVLVSKGGSSFLEMFILPLPAGSPLLNTTQNITATIQSTSNYLGGNFCDGVVVESVSLIGFGQIGVLDTEIGSGTSLSQTIASNINGIVVHGFVTERSSFAVASISSYNKTSDYYSGNYYQGIKNVSGVNLPTGAATLIGHSTGATTVNFTATGAASSDTWFGIAVSFLPSNPEPLGSSFRAYRNSTTAATALAANTDTKLSANFFDTTTGGLKAYRTDDITYDSATNKVTVNYSGTYIINITLSTPSNLSVASFFQALFYVNNLIARRGISVYIPSGASMQGTIAVTGVMNLNAGDYIEPAGCRSVTTSGAGAFVGNSGGDLCAFEVALANRGVTS